MGTEADVVAELKKAKESGDFRAGTAILVREYGEAVRRAMRAALPTAEQAEDLTQTLWADVQEKSFAQFKFDCPPRAWLLRIARYSIADFYDRASRKVDHHDPTDPALDSLVTALGGPQRTNESMMDLARRSGALRAALESLDRADRDLLWDRFVLHMKPEEIASEQDGERSANAISAKLVRLAKKLRSVLEPE